MLIYMAIGALLMFIMLCTDQAKESMSTEYIKYRMEAQAEGESHFNEITFRRLQIAGMYLIMILFWPIVIGYSIIKALLK